jgi:DNA ligase-1
VKRLAEGLELARMRRSRIAKEEAIGAALRAVGADADETSLALAARIASGRVLPTGDGRALGVGWALLLDVVRGATGWDDEVLFACARVSGELAEAFALLAARVDGAERRPGLELSAIARLADALAATPGRAAKRALLDDAFGRTTPIETKYLAKALGGGMRIGAQDGVVQGAIARAFDVPLESVRRAAALVTDVGDLAVLARGGDLASARLTVGKPVAFQLATPIETIAGTIDAGAHVMEDKIDGVRAQAHKTATGEVALFARGLDRVTEAFPEVAEAMRKIAGPAVLDGEIVARGPSGRPRPFQALQTRLRRTRPTAADLAEVRVVLVAFDLLADASGPVLDLPWTARHERLVALLGGLTPEEAITVNAAAPVPANLALEAALDAAFDAARAGGHEGLVLKRIDSLYEAGRRGQSWIKVKRAHATLDVVVVGAQEGHGKRAGALSDYTFAVWRDEELVPIGKAYSGLTDEEIDAMTRRLEGITLERRGGIRLVRPEIVLEVAFDGIQRSARHASGFALRFPRIVRLRDDKAPAEADTLAAVEALFEAQVAGGHREQPAGPTTATPGKRKRKPAVPANQLSLFDDPKTPPR